MLVNENKCRAWRMCVAACPYKKVYYNWSSGKSEKCILCFPRMETGQAPACAHSCVGRIRYMGVLLYDADKIEEAASAPDEDLIQSQLDAILDPWDPEVVVAAQAAGIDADWIDSARQSPLWKFVKEWGLALPLHAEFRTMAMMFYIPPLSPVMSTIERNLTRLDIPDERERLRALRRPGQGAAADQVSRESLLSRQRGNDPPGAPQDARCAHLQTPPERRRCHRRIDVGAARVRWDHRRRGRGDLQADHIAQPGRTVRPASVSPRNGHRRDKRSARPQGHDRPRLHPASKAGCMMGEAAVIAMCFSYPYDERARDLDNAVAGLDKGKVRDHLQHLVDSLAQLSLGEWEELHTRTLDLSPQFVPYVGHIVFGESYRRGAFMADLNREMAELGIDLEGELPDHLAPILRYLEKAPEPNGELVEVLPEAVNGMIKELKKADPKNPYRHVLAATKAHISMESRDDARSSSCPSMTCCSWFCHMWR